MRSQSGATKEAAHLVRPHEARDPAQTYMCWKALAILRMEMM